MAGKKVYAVRKGKKIGIFFTWADCKASIEGVKGAEYKGFSNLQEAQNYLNGKQVADETKHLMFDDTESDFISLKNQENSKKTADSTKTVNLETNANVFHKKQKLLAYVDGSYNHSLKKYSFGCVFILPDKKIYTENGNGDNPKSAALRNVTGEMLGSMFAVRFAMVNGFQEIEICYDYEGIEKWVTGVWQSKTELTQKYTKAMRNWGQTIQITFTKVTAHTNIYYNEMADQLAKEALESTKGIPKIQKIADMKAINEKQEKFERSSLSND